MIRSSHIGFSKWMFSDCVRDSVDVGKANETALLLAAQEGFAEAVWGNQQSGMYQPLINAESLGAPESIDAAVGWPNFAPRHQVVAILLEEGSLGRLLTSQHSLVP